MVNNIISVLKEKFPEATIQEDIVVVPFQSLLSLIELLHGEGFDYLQDITAVDWPDRFTLVYQVCSYHLSTRLEVKTDIPKENPSAPSLTPYWESANWLEREIYDMFGIKFTGHPNMKRILLDEDFSGYPLRKDYQ